jgi:hypothetical protein
LKLETSVLALGCHFGQGEEWQTLFGHGHDEGGHAPGYVYDRNIGQWVPAS